jgi:hypothetical protein
MGILADFEDRVAGAIEGLFAGAFRSPVQPVEIAKAIARAADDGRVLGVATVYAPTAYTVALSAADDENLGTFKPVLAGELATYLVDHARERGYHLSARPQVTFVRHDDLKLGRFRVSAALAEPEPSDEGPAVRLADAPEGGSELATVTVGEIGHDVVLDGDQVVVGRLAECQIRLTDVNVSRRHAAFVPLDDGWAIADLGSTNGTLLNGAQVEKARLKDGDVVEIGLTRLVYHEPRR